MNKISLKNLLECCFANKKLIFSKLVPSDYFFWNENYLLEKNYVHSIDELNSPIKRNIKFFTKYDFEFLSPPEFILKFWNGESTQTYLLKETPNFLYYTPIPINPRRNKKGLMKQKIEDLLPNSKLIFKSEVKESHFDLMYEDDQIKSNDGEIRAFFTKKVDMISLQLLPTIFNENSSEYEYRIFRGVVSLVGDKVKKYYFIIVVREFQCEDTKALNFNSIFRGNFYFTNENCF